MQAFSAAIEESAKAARTTAAPEPRRAAVTLTLTNGNAMSDIWELVLDGGANAVAVAPRHAPISCPVPTA